MKYIIEPNEDYSRWVVWESNRLKKVVVFKREGRGALEKCIEYRKWKIKRCNFLKTIGTLLSLNN